MSNDVIIVSKDIGKRAEGLIASGGSNVTKGIELLLVENVYSEGNISSAGPNQVDCSSTYKRGLKILQDTPFDVLGIDLGCQTLDVRKAYKKLALKYHPDKNPKTTPLFQIIQSACSKLSITEDRHKEELQAHAKKKAASNPTPSSFAPKPTPNNNSSKPQQTSQPNSSYNTPRTGAVPGNGYQYGGGPYGMGSYANQSHGNSQYGAAGSYNYGGAAGGPTSSKPTNSNNPYAQANAQRQAQQNGQNTQNQYGNYKHDEAKRKNYYEELLKEQYRKAAESDQRAKEFAAKRASEQKTEFDTYAKRAQQQFYQYQQQTKPSDPPSSSFRPQPIPSNQANNFGGPSKQPSASNLGNAAPSAYCSDYPSSQSSVNKSTAEQNVPNGIGKTYKTTSDGRVYPQQQYSQYSPRSNDVGGSKPGGGATSIPEASKQPSFSNKKVVPKPFAFKCNSVTSTVVELEWKTSVLHHCNLGVELSWKEKKSTIWEVSEKMIRSGCCRKKNLNAGSVYEFRVRAVEDLPSMSGNKSDWSDTITVALLTPDVGQAAPKNNFKPPTSQQVPPVSSQSQPTEQTPRNFEKDNKRPPPPSELPKPPRINPQSTSQEQETGDKKLQPSAPTKLDSIPQKFRRFNSKMKTGSHQMEVDHDKRYGDYGDVPRPDPPVKMAAPVPPADQSAAKNQFSNSKVLSASAREAWGKDTQSIGATKKQDIERDKHKIKKDLDNLGDDVHYVEVDGEGEIDEEEILLHSKGQSDSHADDDEITEDEELLSSIDKARKVNIELSQNDVDSVNNFDKKLEKLDQEYEKEKRKRLERKKGTEQTPVKRKADVSPFALESDEDEYEDDDFAVEEETHYQLIAPVSNDDSSNGRKRTMGKSKKNVMEVLDGSGVNRYLHPVHLEPFVRSEVKGYLVVDRTIIACASCGDWIRVKIHIMKDGNSESKHVISGPSKPGSSGDVWGWCLTKDKNHIFLQMGAKINEPTRNTPVSGSTGIMNNSSSSSLPTIAPINLKKNSASTSKESSEYRTPLKKKTLESKNSLGNTSLFNLHKPTPKTANKKAANSNVRKKKQGDIEQFDLEESYDEESVPQWMECYDEQGNIYYYNEKTRESSWDAPEWIEEVDPSSGAKYYCHFVYNGEEVSMTSTWTRPKQYARVIRHVTDV